MRTGITKFLKFILSHAAFLSVITFVAGFLVSDFVNFRSDQRSLLKEEFHQSEETAKLVDKQLALLSAVALGQKNKDPAVVTDLSNNAMALFNEAAIITKRIPAAQVSFDRYSDAIVQLREAAVKLSGPKDGKAFVEAVSTYYSTKDEFDKIVVSSQGRYFPFL